MNHLLIFGLGYSATQVARHFIAEGWRVTGTLREPEKEAEFHGSGIETLTFDSSARSPDIVYSIETASHILVSVPPGPGGDPVVARHGADIAGRAGQLEWIGYFSSLSVYGHHDGGWIDETADLTPSTARGARRANAERQWRELAESQNIPLAIFRLAGIYGPGRSAIDSLKAGTARRIVKPGQIFNRIHVADIVQVVATVIDKGPPETGIYNVCDDEPAPPADVITYGASLLGIEPPPAVPIEEAGLSPMGLSFFSEIKRVRNTRIKRDLGVSLVYPDYRVGLKAIVKNS